MSHKVSLFGFWIEIKNFTVDNYTLVCEQYCGPVIKEKAPVGGAPAADAKEGEKKA